MKWKGYKIPLHRTTKKPTSNNESISKFFDDAVLGLTLDARHYKQAKSYLGEAMVGLDGKIHPLYTTVKTGRLAAKRPNLMNLPQGRGSEIMEEAAAIRVAKLGSHAFVLSHYLGRPADLGMDDKALGLYLDGLKGGYPTEYKIVKIANNAFNYRQGLYNMARTLGKSVKETKEIRSVIERAFPKIVQWQNTTMMQAHTQGRLTTPFGFSLSFFNVLDKEGAPSREASECLAFLPQSTGAAMLRTILVDLGGHPEEGTTFSLLIPTHDSITAQVRIGEERRILQMMRESMERRWEELGGMSIEVEAKIGPTMGGLEKWKF
jgi:DNA polymerase I-like protein with 3'-5' exonuclease and polymerase domains